MSCQVYSLLVIWKIWEAIEINNTVAPRGRRYTKGHTVRNCVCLHLSWAFLTFIPQRIGVITLCHFSSSLPAPPSGFPLMALHKVWDAAFIPGHGACLLPLNTGTLAYPGCQPFQEYTNLLFNSGFLNIHYSNCMESHPATSLPDLSHC